MKKKGKKFIHPQLTNLIEVNGQEIQFELGAFKVRLTDDPYVAILKTESGDSFRASCTAHADARLQIKEVIING